MTADRAIILKRTHCAGDNIPSNSTKKDLKYLQISPDVKPCFYSHAFICAGMFTCSKPAKIADKSFNKLKIYMENKLNCYVTPGKAKT